MGEVHPQSLGQLTGSVAQSFGPTPALNHEFFTFYRLEGPYKDGATDAFFFADDVQQVMDAVREVDVRLARFTEDCAVPHRRAVVGVAGRVFGPVGLRLDYEAGGAPFRRVMCQDAAEQVYGDLAGITVVELRL